MPGTISPIGVNSPQVYFRAFSAGPPTADFYADPGNSNPPIIFEPPSDLTGGDLEVWVISSGGASYGGAQVWVSTDGNTYAIAGTLYKGARQGVLTATLNSHADPDTTNTLSVNLAQSSGNLISGTQADADQFVTLCYCDGELVSYETATLVSAFHYDLTYLRRGVYGTPIAAHGIGSKFARFGPNDPSILRYKYPASFVGQTIYIKLTSFNIFGLELQDLSDVSAVSYTLTGGGAELPRFSISDSQTGPTLANMIVGQFLFSSTVIFANNFGGSQAVAGNAATGSTTYLVRKNGTTIGNIVFGAGASVGTFTSVATSTAFNSGDLLAVVAPATPDSTLSDIAWTLDGHQGSSGLVAEIHGSQTGLTTSNLVVGRWVAGNPIVLPAGLLGSMGVAGVAATGSTSYSLNRNGVQFGTMTFSAASASASFSAASDTVISPGDIITVVAPTSPDSTLADLTWSLVGYNSLSNPGVFVEGSISGLIPGSFAVWQYVFDSAMVIPVGMVGSTAIAGTPGVGSTVFSLKKNNTSVGTMTFGAGASSAAFAMTTPTTFNVGDVLTVVSPASPDASLADLTWAFTGTV